MPYHWQYRVTKFDEWKSFGTKDNLRLEKLYCEVNTETRVKFQPAQSLDVSRLERQVHNGTVDGTVFKLIHLSVGVYSFLNESLKLPNS